MIWIQSWPRRNYPLGLTFRYFVIAPVFLLKALHRLAFNKKLGRHQSEKRPIHGVDFRCVTAAFLALAVIWSLLTTPAIAAPTIPNPEALAKAVEEIELLDATRSSLASSLEGRTEEPTMDTMKQVCRPVGMRAMQLSQENGWQVKQLSNKYRNPDHKPDTIKAQIALARLEQNPDLVAFWDRETIAGQEGTRYYRRIDVEASCLACHGGSDRRPQFVKDNYPEDRAFNFAVGDLRGMYSVFIPDAVRESLE